MMCKEIWRVLRPGGVFICVCFGTPDTRLEYLRGRNLAWNIEHLAIPKPDAPEGPVTDLPPSSCYHIYLCTKHRAHMPSFTDFDDDHDV